MDSLNTVIEGLSKGVAGEQTATPNAPEQGTPSNSNAAMSEKDEQSSEVNQQNPKEMRRGCRLLRLQMKNQINGYWCKSCARCVYPQKSHP